MRPGRRGHGRVDVWAPELQLLHGVHEIQGYPAVPDLDRGGPARVDALQLVAYKGAPEDAPADLDVLGLDLGALISRCSPRLYTILVASPVCIQPLDISPLSMKADPRRWR